MDQQHPTFNIHDQVPNLRGGLSESTKWMLGFILGLAALLAGPLTTLIRAPRADDWVQTTRDSAALKEEVHLLKQALDNHVNVEVEVQKRRDLEYGELKDLIKKSKR